MERVNPPEDIGISLQAEIAEGKRSQPRWSGLMSYAEQKGIPAARVIDPLYSIGYGTSLGQEHFDVHVVALAINAAEGAMRQYGSKGDDFAKIRVTDIYGSVQRLLEQAGRDKLLYTEAERIRGEETLLLLRTTFPEYFPEDKPTELEAD